MGDVKYFSESVFTLFLVSTLSLPHPFPLPTKGDNADRSALLTSFLGNRVPELDSGVSNVRGDGHLAKGHSPHTTSAARAPKHAQHTGPSDETTLAGPEPEQQAHGSRAEGCVLQLGLFPEKVPMSLGPPGL